MPDKALPDFLEYLRHLISTEPVSTGIEKLQKSIDKIFNENATLLKTLADS